MTAKVTIAPITPATAFEIPPDPEEEEEEVEEAEEEDDDEEAVVLEAQTPVVFPHAEHQLA